MEQGPLSSVYTELAERRIELRQAEYRLADLRKIQEQAIIDMAYHGDVKQLGPTHEDRERRLYCLLMENTELIRLDQGVEDAWAAVERAKARVREWEWKLLAGVGEHQTEH